MNEKVSVVVTTKNEEKNIANCLESIKLQTWSNVEIIVVDNNSTDKTKDIARQYTDLVFDKGPERSAQRNYGLIDIATGTYGMFIDADMILTPNLLEACVEKMKTEKVVALHIEEIVLGNGRLAKTRRFERSFYSGTCIDGVRFFRTSDFAFLGGFDEALPPGPEDWDLDKRFKNIGILSLLQDNGIPHLSWALQEIISSKGVTHARAFQGIYHNEDQQSIGRYLTKKSYYSGSMARYRNKWNGHPEIKKQLGFSYRFLGVFLERGGWRKIVRHPFLSSSMFVLRVLVGISFAIASFRQSDLSDIYS